VPYEIDLSKRVNREFVAHTSSDVLSASYRLKNRFLHIWRYPSRKSINATVDRYLNSVNGKKVLDYGCGRGHLSLNILSRGAHVCGIDISPVYISDAIQTIAQKGYPEYRYSLRVMDAHALEYEDCTFDLVIGEGILHHLNISVALSEIHRVLKIGGRAIFLEPLADNPLLRIFRLLTPHARTADEKPLSKKDLMDIKKINHWKHELKYCGILEAPTAIFTSILTPKRMENWPLKFADCLERWTHYHGLLLSWNQYVLINIWKKYK
jgi:ubiquinone/menaquinone biosynthesis C-methylase UbiE